jgi:hypothetical protein
MPAGFIGFRPTTTSGSGGNAPGIWNLREVFRQRKADLWPEKHIVVQAANEPTNLAATPAITSVALSWTAPSNMGTETLTEYQIEYSAGSSINPMSSTTVNTGSTNASHTITGLTAGSQYAFRVRAKTGTGFGALNGAYSSTVTATTSAAAADSLWGAVRLLVPFETSVNSVTHADGQQVSGTMSGTSGSPSSAVSTDGKFSNGFRYYQGTVTYSTSTFNSTNWTVEFWFKRNTDYSFTTQRQVMKFGDFIFRHTTSNNFILYDDDDGSAIGSFGTAALNTWEHYAIVYQNGTMRLYKGGTQVASSTGTLSAPSSVVIGRSSFGLYNFSLDDLRVTDVARYPDGTAFSVPTAAHGTSSGTGKIDINIDTKARFYLHSTATSVEITAETTTNYYKVTHNGSSIIAREHPYHTYATYYFNTTTGGGNFTITNRPRFTSVNTSAVVVVESCDINGNASGSLRAIDISKTANKIRAVDISGCTSLQTINAGATGGPSTKIKPYNSPSGTRSMASLIDQVRAVSIGTALGGQTNQYYSPTWTPNVYVYTGGFDFYNQQLDAAALNQLYTDIANSGHTGASSLMVGENSGTGSDNPSLATGVTVYGS